MTLKIYVQSGGTARGMVDGYNSCQKMFDDPSGEIKVSDRKENDGSQILSRAKMPMPSELRGAPGRFFQWLNGSTPRLVQGQLALDASPMAASLRIVWKAKTRLVRQCFLSHGRSEYHQY